MLRLLVSSELTFEDWRNFLRRHENNERLVKVRLEGRKSSGVVRLHNHKERAASKRLEISRVKAANGV